MSRGAAIGGGAGVLLLLAFVLLGGDPSELVEFAAEEGAPPAGPAADEASEFARHILGSTEETWETVFARRGESYRAPTLVLFDDAVQSACGFGTAATGPFYCPPDRRVYLDLSFFRDLARMGGAGDFARAYVIGHEVGHHVQNLVGTSDRVRRLQARAAPADRNALAVLLELQADCYAGLWAHHANRSGTYLEPRDVEEGLRAAAAIGDDRLQRRAGRRVQPESFTHGSSAERVRWLRTGLETGSLEACDTFERAG